LLIVMLSNLANDAMVWSNQDRMLHCTRFNSSEAKSPAVRSGVLHRRPGRVALEAMNGSGFVIVVRLGFSGDARLLKKETGDSLFRCQGRLRGQCRLLPLKSHRPVGLDPLTGEPCSAKSAGTRLDRKEGAVLTST
jgi:xylan 1,4-beta-xylosidase